MSETVSRQCPRCKQFTDVSRSQAARGRNTCKACDAAYHRQRYAERQDIRMYHRAKSMEHSPRYALPFELANKVFAGTQCAYCLAPNDGTTEMGIDHDVPISRGGTNDEANLVLCCSVCNQGKRSMTGEEYRAWLAGVVKRAAGWA